ncbi:MAG TPA: response regulator [Steroidobacteraceae bacterium]|jgi:CheY-like chemotaxis protein
MNPRDDNGNETRGEPGGPPGTAPPGRTRREGEVLVHGIVVHPPQARAELGLMRGMPLRILIADDYVDAAESLALLLSRSGIETQVAVEGEQALLRANGWRPHVCILDIEMPGLDGKEIARRIRAQNWRERPLLIAVSGWTAAQDRMSALDAGFDHYLMKPVEPARLVRIIQSYLDSFA